MGGECVWYTHKLTLIELTSKFSSWIKKMEAPKTIEAIEWLEKRKALALVVWGFNPLFLGCLQIQKKITLERTKEKEHKCSH